MIYSKKLITTLILKVNYDFDLLRKMYNQRFKLTASFALGFLQVLMLVVPFRQTYSKCSYKINKLANRACEES
jgi:hypothetical protein